jgi:hypothetical protein
LNISTLKNAPVWLPNVLRTTKSAGVFGILTFKRVSHNSHVHFFKGSTAKSFSFSTSKRSRHNGVHFQPLNFQKFFALLRATAASNFWSLIPREEPAPLASLPFDPPGPQNIGNTERFATSLPFRALWSSF